MDTVSQKRLRMQPLCCNKMEMASPNVKLLLILFVFFIFSAPSASLGELHELRRNHVEHVAAGHGGSSGGHTPATGGGGGDEGGGAGEVERQLYRYIQLALDLRTIMGQEAVCARAVGDLQPQQQYLLLTY